MKLKELSALLGLSQTTISRALNGYPEVSEDTRRRVLQVAQDTGYRPNRAAQRLATGKAGSIGLIMPTAPEQSSDMHFAEFQSGLAEAAIRQDFHFVIMPTHRQDEEQAIRWLVASGSVDGYYLAYLREDDPRIPLAQSLNLPFIVHGRSIGIPEDYPYLDVDNEDAFYSATRLLTQLGHKRIALLNGPSELDFALRRKLGTERALNATGLQLDARHVRHSLMDDEQGYRGMREILTGPERPTAVLCASTVLALGAVRAMNELGLKLGRDMSLIAHDDELPLLKPENFSIPLTTTRSSLRAAGKRVGERLIAMINGAQPPLPERELWKAELVVRASTGPAPQDI